MLDGDAESLCQSSAARSGTPQSCDLSSGQRSASAAAFHALTMFRMVHAGFDIWEPRADICVALAVRLWQACCSPVAAFPFHGEAAPAFFPARASRTSI